MCLYVTFFLFQNPLVGNVDQNSIQRNTLSPQINARYIQINPIEWYEGNGNEADKHDICMRAALFKCKGEKDELDEVSPKKEKAIVFTFMVIYDKR